MEELDELERLKEIWSRFDVDGELAQGDTVIKRPSPLNVLKYIYEHSCC
jgi:hypothetical protein